MRNDSQCPLKDKSCLKNVSGRRWERKGISGRGNSTFRSSEASEGVFKEWQYWKLGVHFGQQVLGKRTRDSSCKTRSLMPGSRAWKNSSNYLSDNKIITSFRLPPCQSFPSLICILNVVLHDKMRNFMMTAVKGKLDIHMVCGKRWVLFWAYSYNMLLWTGVTCPLRNDCNSVWVELVAGIWVLETWNYG